MNDKDEICILVRRKDKGCIVTGGAHFLGLELNTTRLNVGEMLKAAIEMKSKELDAEIERLAKEQ